MKHRKKVMLIVLDGFGIGKRYEGNAIRIARMPFYRSLLKKYPHAKLKASGRYVGLPRGYTGNSEVGHLHLGAGRVVLQPLELINKKIKDGSFFKNKELLQAFKQKRVHVIGLCSDGGVHSHIKHLIALANLAKQQKKKIYVHCFLDGRDVPERSAQKYLSKLPSNVVLCSYVGRYYAMDRDNNWDRTKKAFELLTKGKGIKTSNPFKTLQEQQKKHTDYYVEPVKIKGTPNIEVGDAVIFFNFRTDRARQISKLLSSLDIYFVGFERYEKDIDMHVAFKHERIKNNLASVLAKHKIRQLRVAETEKYAHVTYFFNSQIEKPYPYEDRVLVPSPKVPSYDQKPEMSAYEITNKVLENIDKGYGFILINYANPDLVGHSGNLKAVVKALEHIDKNLSMLIPKAIEKEYSIIITADHGNAEKMLYDNGEPCPSHTTNPVPIILIDNGYKKQHKKLINGSLIDVAPTVLAILGIKKPKEMTGTNLIQE